MDRIPNTRIVFYISPRLIRDGRAVLPFSPQSFGQLEILKVFGTDHNGDLHADARK